MKLEYVNRIVAILPIIYQKDKVQYVNNKFAMIMENLLIGQRVDQMRKVSKKHKRRNNQKITKKGCMPFYYCLTSLVFRSGFH
jgi:hypothetical protein